MPLCCISFVPLLLIKMLSDTFLYSLDFAYDARCDEKVEYKALASGGPFVGMTGCRSVIWMKFSLILSQASRTENE